MWLMAADRVQVVPGRCPRRLTQRMPGGGQYCLADRLLVVYRITRCARAVEHTIPMTSRTASIQRDTLETRIRLELDLDGNGQATLRSGVPFLDHMLDQVARHGRFDLSVQCEGDTQIDDHHSVEDIGISLGMAVHEAVGDKRGLTRYGHAYVPLDEALSRVVIDLSGRPGLWFDCPFQRDRVGTFDVELCREFFQGFANHAGATLHIDLIRGENEHHKIETIFKAFGRALRLAVSEDARMAGDMPSTKGAL